MHLEHLENSVNDHSRVVVAVFSDQLEDAFFAKTLVTEVARVTDSVGEKDEQIFLADPAQGGRIWNVVKHAEWRIDSRETRHRSLLTDDECVRVSGIGVIKLPFL